MKRAAFLLSSFLSLVIVMACSSKQREFTGPSKVEILKQGDSFSLLVNGEPYRVKGAGMQSGNMDALASHGANTYRTWRLYHDEERAKRLLDKADSLGLKVAMGLHVGLERSGFNYDDTNAVQEQLERIKAEVLSVKDHPAILFWVIGNELNHHATNPKVWDAVNDISQMIHSIDTYHLTTTPLAGMRKEDLALVQERASDLDFLSVQMYGEIEILPQRIKASGYEGPLMITEWGATGYWEVPKTEWGAPIENNSSVKADYYRSRYEEAIASQADQVIGSFVFLWGQKQERTPTWFGMFTADGQETESIDVMHYIWQGAWPENRSPRLEGFRLEGQGAVDNIKLLAGDLYQAEVRVQDPEKDNLVYRWEIMHESQSKATGGDPEPIPAAVNGLFEESTGPVATFVAPAEAGAYRLFIYVEDGHNHVAHANIPFWVNSSQ